MIFCCRVTNKIKKKDQKICSNQIRQISSEHLTALFKQFYNWNEKKKVQILSLNCDMSLNKDSKGKHCKIKK